MFCIQKLLNKNWKYDKFYKSTRQIKLICHTDVNRVTRAIFDMLRIPVRDNWEACAFTEKKQSHILLFNAWYRKLSGFIFN